jgi:hypothetical protein
VYPRLFLSAGGSVLLLLGVVGYANVFTEAGSPSFWLDGTENLVHTILGLVALGAVFVQGRGAAVAAHHRWIVGLIALPALFFGVYGFLLPAGSSAHPNLFGVANLESPADNLLHLVIGITAAMALLVKPMSERTASRGRLRPGP